MGGWVDGWVDGWGAPHVVLMGDFALVLVTARLLLRLVLLLLVVVGGGWWGWEGWWSAAASIVSTSFCIKAPTCASLWRVMFPCVGVMVPDVWVGGWITSQSLCVY